MIVIVVPVVIPIMVFAFATVVVVSVAMVTSFLIFLAIVMGVMIIRIGNPTAYTRVSAVASPWSTACWASSKTRWSAPWG